MKKILGAAAVFCLLAGQIFAAKYEIKFASVAPAGSTWMNVMEELEETISDKTDGEVGFKFYAGSVSGDEKDVLRKMRIGQLHAGGFTSQGLGEIVPEIRILNVPLLLRTEAEVDYVMDKKAGYFEKKFEKKGYKVLGWPEVGFVYVLSTEKIESLDDLRKLKMWIWGEDILVNTLFSNLGVSPIPLSLVDVMQSLQTGLIEGVYGSPLAALASQWTTKTDNLLDMRISYVPGGILITKKQWNRIPEKHRAVIEKECGKAFDGLTELSRKENRQALEIMKEQGVVFTSIKSGDDIAVFEKASEKTALELIGEYYEKELLDEIKGYLEEFRGEKN
ncbi:MAG: TRAP transporter substrate-binding protein DctP [Candidatus Goldiibacteriota bacterium]